MLFALLVFYLLDVCFCFFLQMVAVHVLVCIPLPAMHLHDDMAIAKSERKGRHGARMAAIQIRTLTAPSSRT
jgi:hypothetical protein